MVKRSDDMKGFVVLPKRWCVERTFGWFGKYRLLSKEYEGTLESSKADIFLAMTSLMLRRLTRPADERQEARKSWSTPSKELVDLTYVPGKCAPAGGVATGTVEKNDADAVTWCCLEGADAF